MVWHLSGCIGLAQTDSDNLGVKEHHTKNGFKNPYVNEEKKSFFSFMSMRLFGEEKWADYEANKHTVPTQQVVLATIQNPGIAPQITWIGHSTFLIQYQGLTILTDPIFSEYASPFNFAGPKRVHPPALRLEDLPKIDFVIISHNHYDHLDFSTVQQIGNNTQWVIPLGHLQWFDDVGVSREHIQEFDWWDSLTKDQVQITATPSQHWSGRGLWDRFESLWASWVIQIDDIHIWFGGDTGYNPYQFKQIGDAFPEFDIALIPIGAYAPRWFMKNMHVNPAEAVKIHLDIQSKQSFGIHWGTFPLTAEPVDEPPKRLKDALKQADIPEYRFQTLKIGETRIVTRNSSVSLYRQ